MGSYSCSRRAGQDRRRGGSRARRNARTRGRTHRPPPRHLRRQDAQGYLMPQHERSRPEAVQVPRRPEHRAEDSRGRSRRQTRTGPSVHVTQPDKAELVRRVRMPVMVSRALEVSRPLFRCPELRMQACSARVIQGRRKPQTSTAPSGSSRPACRSGGSAANHRLKLVYRLGPKDRATSLQGKTQSQRSRASGQLRCHEKPWRA
jgi:hypothetical protein